ncbi:MAG: hypothetical protein ACFB15_31225 [Cyclobacteriaceae bacterium]
MAGEQFKNCLNTKEMKFLKSKNENSKWAWLTLLLVGIISLGVISCSEDEDNNLTPDGGVEAESGYLQVYQVRTPSGVVMYANIGESFPDKIDLSNSIELGSNIGVVASGDNFFVINTNAQTISKWEIDKSTIEANVTGVLSYASLGLTGFVPIAFIDDSKAVLAGFFDGVIAEFNSETMEITETRQIQPLMPGSSNGVSASITSNGIGLENGKVMYSFQHVVEGNCCDFPFDEPTPFMAIYDPSSGSVEYISDERLPIGGLFSTSDANGNWYMSPNYYLEVNRHYFGLDDRYAKYYTIRVDPNGNIDPSFECELSSAITIDYGGQINAVLGNEILVNYQDIDTWPSAYSDRWNWWGNPDFTNNTVIDMTTNATKPFTAFDDYSLGSFYITTIDGDNYFVATTLPEGADVSNQQGDLLRQVSFDEFVLVTEGAPSFNVQNVAKLW